MAFVAKTMDTVRSVVLDVKPVTAPAVPQFILLMGNVEVSHSFTVL
jgi:hypothetical protein